MPTLEELLRASLQGANEKYDQANSALHAAVVETAKAVQAVTGGKASLQLVRLSISEIGTRYNLMIFANGGTQARVLASFSVPKDGYPISRATDANSPPQQEFKSSEEISVYFQKLASNPNSPLVAYLAYIVRNPPEE